MTLMPERARAVILRVAAKHQITPEDIVGRSRAPRYAWPRQEVMAELVALRRGTKNNTVFSAVQVGRWLGRDHSTVLHGVRRHAERVGEGA